MAAVLPAGSLVTVACSPWGEFLRLAELVQPLNVVICRSLTGRPARAEGDQGPTAHT